MEGTELRAMLARVVVACAIAGAMVAWAPASMEGSPGPEAVQASRRLRSTWHEQVALRPPPDVAWQLGAAVAMHEGTLAVGPAHDWDLGQDHGGVRIFSVSDQRLVDAGELRHPAEDTQAFFGAAVAVHGACLAVGAPHDGTAGFHSGAVFVHSRGASGWELRQMLQAPHAMSGDLAGSAIAMDGDTIVVGVPKADAEGLDTGAAEVFERVGGEWLHAGTLTARQPRVGALFGLAVAVHGDTAFIGAPGDDAAGPMAGRVHVFRRTHAGWSRESEILCPAGTRGWFGASVAAAGDLIVVGAPRATRPGTDGSRARGAAWRVEQVDGAWRCTALLVPPNPAEGESFGCAAATDGVTAVFGATADSVRGRLAGCGFAFHRAIGGTWVGQRLDPGSIAPTALVGHGVTVDGDVLALGRLGDPEADTASGEVTVFRRDTDRDAAASVRPSAARN